MLDENDKREIKEVIRECFAEILSEQGMTPAEHTAQHTYIKSLQETSGIIKKASWWTLISTIIAAIIYAIFHNN